MPGGEPLFFYTDIYITPPKRPAIAENQGPSGHEELQTIEKLAESYCLNIQRLIDHNHKFEDIDNYTLTKFTAACYNVNYLEASNIEKQILVYRQAQYGDINSIEAFIYGLKYGKL